MSLVLKVQINDRILAVITARRLPEATAPEPVRHYRWERHDVRLDGAVQRADLVSSGELWHDTSDGALGLAQALLQVVNRHA